MQNADGKAKKTPPALPPRQRPSGGQHMQRVVPENQAQVPGALLLADVDDLEGETVDEAVRQKNTEHVAPWPKRPVVPAIEIDGYDAARPIKKSSGCSPLGFAAMDAEAEELIEDMEQLFHRHMKEVKDSVSRWVIKQKRILVQELQAGMEQELPATREAFVPTPSLQAVVPSSNSNESSPKQGFAGRSPSMPTPKTARSGRKKAGLLFASSEPDDKTCLQKLTEGRVYEYASIVLIVLNSAFIGWQTQHMAARAESDATIGIAQQTDTPTEFTVLSMIFNILFTADLILRWAAAGLKGFWWTAEDGWSESLGWNILDTIIVLIGTLDMIMLVLSWMTDGSAESALSEFSVHRVIRVVRIVKVARVIRVMKFFRELRMMIFSIINSSKSLVWVMLVLGLMFYIFGITFVAGVSGYLDTSDKWSDPANQELVKYFGTLDRAFVALYMAMSGGNDWVVYFEALELTAGIYHYLFLIFITFAIFAVVNIVTGVFVDSALQSNTTDHAMLVQEELEVKKAKLVSMKAVFENLDEDGTGTFTIDEFENRLRDERVQAYFSTLKLDVGDAKALFRLLDYDQSNEITIDEFVEGCSQLQGEARSLDAKIMQFELKFLKEATCDIIRMLRELQDERMPLVKTPSKEVVSS